TAPQTGDTSSLFTWLAVAVVTGTLFIIVNTKMRRAANER
ncbi:MAG: LPXTG cell wall anchor domain-containing protein, partial [Clostridia bacterium]|nr:LPXTG cell wall anchor domain-containing protein [Clostridia bacterium]